MSFADFDTIEQVLLNYVCKDELLANIQPDENFVQEIKSEREPFTFVIYEKVSYFREKTPRPDRHALRGVIPRQTGLFPLYDLSDFGIADVVSVGRGRNNLINCNDLHVSREHGLVVLYKRKPLFIDYGTPDSENLREGSKNGTWINDRKKIQNASYLLRERDYLGFGDYLRDENGRKVVHFLHDNIIRKNRIRYELP